MQDMQDPEMYASVTDVSVIKSGVLRLVQDPEIDRSTVTNVFVRLYKSDINDCRFAIIYRDKEMEIDLGVLNLTKCSVSPVCGGTNRFCVRSPNKEHGLVFESTSPVDLSDWMDVMVCQGKPTSLQNVLLALPTRSGASPAASTPTSTPERSPASFRKLTT